MLRGEKDVLNNQENQINLEDLPSNPQLHK